MYGEGISKEGDLLDLAVDKKIVDKSGTWFAFNGDRLGQGRENVKQFLKDNPETMKAIETRVRRELGLRRKPPPSSARRSRPPAAHPGGSGRAPRERPLRSRPGRSEGA